MIKLTIAVVLVITALITSSVYHSTQLSNINYFKGHRLYVKSQFSQAIPYFNKALLQQPKKINALQELAYSYQWTKQYPSAIEVFNKILAIEPKNYKIKMSLAQSYSWQNDYPQAIRVYAEIIRDTDNKEAKIALAEVYIWDKQFAKAEELSRELIKINPKNVKARIILAESLQYLGNYEEAMQVYKELLLEKKLNAIEKEELEELLGETAMTVKDYDTAIKFYREVLDKDPKNVKARMHLANILSWKGNYDESIAQLQIALKQDPENIKLKERLAEVYAWKKDYTKAESIYREMIRQGSSGSEAYASLGKTLLYSGDIEGAKEFLIEALDKNPSNLEIKVDLADSYAYSREFKKAIKLYQEVLKVKETVEVDKKLADVLSWDKQYSLSIKFYDDALAKREDQSIRLQKARVFGWAKEYVKSLNEYKKILDMRYDKLVDLEMLAKQAYWNGRIERAIEYYNKLISAEPQNTEAIFDLSQIYSYQSMWQEAIAGYDKILAVYPNHFRAKEGKEKAGLLREHIMVKTGYEFLKQVSSSRDMDVKRNSYFSLLSFPLDDRLTMDFQYRFTRRNFSDFNAVIENESRLKLSYFHSPEWWVGGFYNYTDYSEHIKHMDTFGTNENFRVWDMGVFSLSQERERLENNSTVIRNRAYRDNYKERLDLDINNKFKAGADYLFAAYSDNNFLHEPGLDMLYLFSLDPKQLSLKYRYFYQNFRNKQSDYFSPKGFSTNSLCLNWKHHLTKEEIFFGADDFYYDLGYEVSCDSTGIVGNKFSGELNWDISKRLNFNIRASVTNSSAGVYRDKNIMANIKYYF